MPHELKYDWKAIQAYYDQGYSVRECYDKFGFGRTALTKAVKSGRIALRSHKEAQSLRRKGHKTTEVECGWCKKKFQRLATEVARNIKRGREIFCSRSCHGKHRNMKEGSRLGSMLGVIPPNCYRQKDEYSDFRYHMCRIRQRCKKLGRVCEITPEILKEIWEKQGGRCPYTGWQLKLKSNEKTPDLASVDRIDSKMDYVTGNVEFVSLIAQYAKNDWDADVIAKFGRAVVEHKRA